MKNYRTILSYGLVIAAAGICASCERFFDIPPQNQLTPEQHYRDVYDANAAIRGIYGELITLADQYVILNELRGDLMDVTYNADYHLRQINQHEEISPDNPYADPKPFYSVINNCNDVLYNFDIMLKDLKFSKEEYNQRYSDILTLRSWLYLQMVIHFGNVPYITEPIDLVDDLEKLTDGTYPVLSIEDMIDTLINVMESLPHLALYSDPSFRTVIDGYNTRIMFIDKEIFLGDLYLWNGEYELAASYYKYVMERDIGQNRYDSYKCCYGDVYTLTKFNSGYTRYYYMDEYSALNNWPLMFSAEPSTDYYDEWMWALYFLDDYPPENPFLDMFSLQHGNYLLKPAEGVLELWDAQVKRNGFLKDFRGNTGSYELIGEEPVITKYISSYNLLNPFEKGGQWHLWRTGLIHLRFIEAANRDGQHRVAMALMNAGINIEYMGDPNATDITYLQRTNLPFPYDFDGRKGATWQIPLGVRGLWHRNTGIRGRVYLEDFTIPEASDSLMLIEDHLLDECAMELAFEGHRWGDLVRISLRRNDPAILADRIYDKLSRAGYANAEEVHAKLMSRENWFLPFNVD
ncbi:MAG: RagB/SusD family nutrient uptake outer membrane protein [Bacteroidales bacterium]|nr:RagB/SusD family nutrient uptake outer membrane protein [Bacteroidales bacterium]MBN2697189.1 RagB/SusD family nutrient uptake outer membrane protein [Bacteroidales bacterium]